jgi:competence protein ComFA
MRFTTKNGIIIPQKEDSLPISKIDTIPQPEPNPNFSYNQDIQLFLTGKQLLLVDLSFTIKEIQEHYENGYVTYRHGITYKGKKPFCVRCGNKESFATYPCARCGELCLYCRHCIMMGRISACTPLIGWSGPPAAIHQPDQFLEWKGTLSEGQKDASNRVGEAVRLNKELLVWAV